MEKICSIPINPRSQEDKLIWAGTDSGRFSVRSAYHLEVERRNRDNWSTFNFAFCSSHLASLMETKPSPLYPAIPLENM